MSQKSLPATQVQRARYADRLVTADGSMTGAEVVAAIEETAGAVAELTPRVTALEGRYEFKVYTFDTKITQSSTTITQEIYNTFNSCDKAVVTIDKDILPFTSGSDLTIELTNVKGSGYLWTVISWGQRLYFLKFSPMYMGQYSLQFSYETVTSGSYKKFSGLTWDAYNKRYQVTLDKNPMLSAWTFIEVEYTNTSSQPCRMIFEQNSFLGSGNDSICNTIIGKKLYTLGVTTAGPEYILWITESPDIGSKLYRHRLILSDSPNYPSNDTQVTFITNSPAALTFADLATLSSYNLINFYSNTADYIPLLYRFDIDYALNKPKITRLKVSDMSIEVKTYDYLFQDSVEALN